MDLTLTIAFLIALIVSRHVTEGLQLLGTYNSVFKNAKCDLNVTTLLNITMRLDCVAYCAKEGECGGVNFKSPNCEFLATVTVM